MKNFSKVYLSSRERMNFQCVSMTEQRSNDNGYIDTVYYIPADAKMGGL